jgi:TP901 family phage tail tape measure protein
MADAFRGLTIRLGADARPLNSAINSITKSAGQAQAQMNRLSKALRMDPSSVKAMAARIDLAGDKTMLAARQAQVLRKAMRQAANETLVFSERSGIASGKIRAVAADTKSVYSATQKLRSEATHYAADLQHVYDALKRSAVASKSFSSINSWKKADKFVKGLQSSLSRTGPVVDKAKEKIRQLFATIDAEDEVFKSFGVAAGEVGKLEDMFWDLRAAFKAADSDLKSMSKVEGYRAIESSVAAVKAELRGAAAEAVRFRSELYAAGSSQGIANAVADARRLDAALEQSSNSAKEMRAAFKAMPTSTAAAISKIRATADAEDVLKAKIDAVNNAIRKMEGNAGASRLEASGENLYLAFEKAAQKAEKLEVAESRVKARLEGLEDELKELDFIGPTQQARRGFDDITSDIEMTSAALDKLASKKNKADSQLADASGAKALREMRNEAEKLKAELATINLNKSLLSKLGGVGQAFRQFGYGLYSTVTPAVMMAGRYAVQAAEDIDSAYRDMRKTVNGTDEDFEALREDAIEFSKSHVTSAQQMLEIEAIGGQLGVAVSDLRDFAHTVSNLDIATNMESEDIATNLGKMASVIGINVDQYDNFGDALVRLGNNMPVMESDIMNLTTRYMGMGKVVGMTAPQMLAWSAAASATGQRAEAAGSAMQRFISKMETAVVGGGDDLDKWAKVAGMSADEFADAFGKDASGAMYRFVEGLGKIQKEGGSVNQTLADLKINNVRDKQLLEGLAQQMANSADGASLLARALQMSQDAYDGMATVMSDGSVELAGDAMREAEKKSEGFSGELGKMTNKAKALAMEAGEAATPIIHDLGESFEQLTGLVQSMPDDMQTKVVGLAGGLAALGPASVALGTTFSALGNVSGGINAFGGKLVEASAKLDPIGPKMQYTSKAGAALGRMFGSVGKVLGSSAGIPAVAGAAIAIGLISDAVGTAVKRYEEYKGATEGFVEATAKIKAAAKATEKDFREQGEALSGSLYDAGSLKEATERVTRENAELSASISSTIDEAVGKGAEIQYYGDLINDLAGKCEGSAGKVALLKDALEKFNELAGTDYSVINNYTGDISALNDEIERNIELVQQRALANAFATATQGTADQIAETSVEIQKNENVIEENGNALKEYGIVAEDTFNGTAASADGARQAAENLAKAGVIGQDDVDKVAELAQGYMSSKENVEKLTPQVENLQKELDTAANAYDKQRDRVEKTQDALEKEAEAARTATTYQKELGEGASFEKVAKKAGYAKDETDKFSQALFGAGISAGEFAEMGTAQFMKWDRQAATATSNVEDQIRLVGAAWSVVNTMQIDPKHVKITDDGSIQLIQDKLTEVEKQKLVELGVKVNDDGTIQGLSDFIDSLTSSNKSVEVNVESKGAEEVADDASTIEESMDAVDGDTSTVGFEAEGADTVIDATEAVKEAAENGFSEITVTVNTNANEVITSLDSLNGYELGEKKVTVNDNAEDVKGRLDEINGYKLDPKSVNVSVTGGALSTIASIRTELNNLDGKTAHTYVVVHKSTEGKTATGAIFNSRGKIPLNAAGALNGIVTRAMMTNIGWVGEAGAEAVMHMRNAGGAVIPLSNRRYVRPFAMAVAAEIGGRGQSQPQVVNNYSINGVTFPEGSDGAIALQALAKALKVEAGR